MGHSSQQPSRASKKVLVIDDSEVARATMRDALESAGHRVHELPSAIGATREVLRHEIEVVVIDLNMPAMRGDSVIRLFRANPRMRHLRLILVSGAPRPEIEAVARDVLADDWVEKAMMPDALLRAVSSDGETSP